MRNVQIDRREGGLFAQVQWEGTKKGACGGGGAQTGAHTRRRSRTHLEHTELARARNPRDAEITLAHRHERAPLFGVAHHLPSKKWEFVRF